MQKIGFDTAENESRQVRWKIRARKPWFWIVSVLGSPPSRRRLGAPKGAEARKRRRLAMAVWAQHRKYKYTRYVILLHGARSRLYLRRSLQVNTHVLAFFEIYKILTPLHLSELKILEKNCQTFRFFIKICKKSLFFNKFHQILHRFGWNFLGISQKTLENVEFS